jgi:hypothetical protein
LSSIQKQDIGNWSGAEKDTRDAEAACPRAPIAAWRAITRRGAGVPLTGLAGDLMARPRKHRRAAKAIILRLGKSWMSDRTKNALIIVVVVCLAIVVAELWIGISPD